MTIRSIGVDLVDLQRFHTTCNRNPALVRKVLTDREIAAGIARSTQHGAADTAPIDMSTLLPLPTPMARFFAGRFAVKEAVAKALGSPGGLRWHDCETLPEPSGAARLHTTGTITRAAKQRGIETWMVSISHDGGMVIAMVIGAS